MIEPAICGIIKCNIFESHHSAIESERTWKIKEDITLQQQLRIRPASRISETPMKWCWQMPSQDDALPAIPMPYGHSWQTPQDKSFEIFLPYRNTHAVC